MVTSLPEFKSLFEGKRVECVRVDGAMDESPCLQEVQFQWTERHLQQGSLCTVVSARYSGGSYLNKVELQNGCLALGHSNVFIPSTIHGSNQGDDGQLCEEKLKKNLDAAAEVYINTVSGTPCFGTKIHLIKGATDEVTKLYCDRRSKLLTFLRGSKKAKKTLQQLHPDDYQYFLQIWELCKRHMVQGLPTNYLFMLKPCYIPECPHPECLKGKPSVEPTWYPGGPPLAFLPLPIPDPERAWGTSCTQCTGICTGHYLKPEQHIEWVKEKGDDACQKVTPRVQIEKYVEREKDILPEHIDYLARTNFLSREDTEICVQHFASKIARKERNRKKRSKATAVDDETDVYCICRKGEDGLMIQCDGCDEWFHGECVSVTQEDADKMEQYICGLCLEDTDDL